MARFNDPQFQIANGQCSKVAAKTAAYTALLTDHVILGNATSAAFSVTLPALADAYVDGIGLELYISKTDASGNAVTIDGAASETINGATTLALSAQHACAHIIAGPSGWRVLSLYVPA